MAAPEKSYDDAAIKEDLANEIENISPVENWFLKNLRKTKARSTTHVNLVETLKTPAQNAMIEGADTVYADRTRPTRVDNLTQIIEIPFSVSTTEQWVDHAGFDDRYEHEAEKAMKEWGNDAERAIVRETRQAGNAATARRMDGIINKITTNVVNGGGNTVWSETVLNNMSELAYWAGGTPTDLFLSPALKRKSSQFTNGDRQNYNPERRRNVRLTNEYEGDFGVISFHMHRFINDQADSSVSPTGAQRALLLDVDLWAIAYGEKPHEEELAKTGLAVKGHVYGELTLESRNEAGNAKAIAMAAS